MFRALHAAADSPYYEEYGATEKDEPYCIVEPADWSTTEDTAWKYYYKQSFLVCQLMSVVV
jgi:hypothetical protein